MSPLAPTVFLALQRLWEETKEAEGRVKPRGILHLAGGQDIPFDQIEGLECPNAKDPGCITTANHKVSGQSCSTTRIADISSVTRFISA